MVNLKKYENPPGSLPVGSERPGSQDGVDWFIWPPQKGNREIPELIGPFKRVLEGLTGLRRLGF